MAGMALPDVYTREGGALFGGVELQRKSVGSTSFGQALQSWLALGGADQVSKPFLENPWVHICLSVYAEAFAGLPFKIWASDAEDAPEVPEGDPVRQLFEQPHPVIGGTALHESLIVHYLHDGEEFWFFDKPLNGRNVPTCINPVRGALVSQEQEEPDKNGKRSLLLWKFESGGVEVKMRPDQTVRFARHNPYGFRGVGVVTALARSINNYFQAERFDDAVLKNAGSPGSVWHSDQPLTEVQAREAQKRIEEKLSPENRGKPLVLGAGLKGDIVAWSPHDMEFSTLRSWLAEIIRAGFRVPNVLLGLEDEKGFSRAGQEEQRKAFHKDAIAPRARRFEDEINRNLIAKLPPPYNRYRVGYDDSELLEDSLDELIDRTLKLRSAGIPFNAAASLAGWDIDPVEGGDEVPAPTSPGDSADEDGGSRRYPVGTQFARSSPPDSGDTGAPPPSTPSRAEIAKRFDEGLVPYDKTLAKAIERTFRDYLSDVKISLAKYAALAPDQPQRSAKAYQPTEGEIDSVLPELASLQASMRDAVAGPLLEVFTAKTREFAQEFNLQRLIEATDPETTAYLLTKEIELAEGISSTLSKQVKRTIIRYLEDVEGSVSLADSIRSTLEGLLGQVDQITDKVADRALLIARTETTSVANGGRVLLMVRNGVAEHEWASADDPQVRESHAQIDGTVRQLGQEFGFGLRWPGDPNADVSQVANCRCTTIPRLPEQ